MTRLHIFRDAYPEQLLGAVRDEIQRAERAQQKRDAAAERRREWWDRRRARLRAFAASRNE